MAIAAGVSLAVAAQAAPGVTVALLPAAQAVAPGASFEIVLQVTAVGDSFNAFDAVVRYDPAALTIQPLSPTSLQQGSYLTTACSNTFHRFSSASDSLSITDVLLCQNLALPGPGQIYRLHFVAGSTPQVTQVRLDSVQFYKAGLFVDPAATANAEVTIGATAVAPGAGGRGLRLTARPNPGCGSTVLRLESAADGEQTLEIFDLRGRLLRRWIAGAVPSGSREIVWNGRDERGGAAGPGIYLARLLARGRTATARIVLVE